jgi:hypothetical protein
MKVQSLILALFFVAVAGCGAKPTPSGNPEWVDRLIRQFESEAVGNPPQSIWRYEYNGQVVYYVPAQCCDMTSTLYDANGNVVCAPDGGLTGGGDGKCKDFSSRRTQEQLIWKDSRQR